MMACVVIVGCSKSGIDTSSRDRLVRLDSLKVDSDYKELVRGVGDSLIYLDKIPDKYIDRVSDEAIKEYEDHIYEEFGYLEFTENYGHIYGNDDYDDYDEGEELTESELRELYGNDEYERMTELMERAKLNCLSESYYENMAVLKYKSDLGSNRIIILRGNKKDGITGIKIIGEDVPVGD